MYRTSTTVLQTEENSCYNWHFTTVGLCAEKRTEQLTSHRTVAVNVVTFQSPFDSFSKNNGEVKQKMLIHYYIPRMSVMVSKWLCKVCRRNPLCKRVSKSVSHITQKYTTLLIRLTIQTTVPWLQNVLHSDEQCSVGNSIARPGMLCLCCMQMSMSVHWAGAQMNTPSALMYALTCCHQYANRAVAIWQHVGPGHSITLHTVNGEFYKHVSRSIRGPSSIWKFSLHLVDRFVKQAFFCWVMFYLNVCKRVLSLDICSIYSLWVCTRCKLPKLPFSVSEKDLSAVHTAQVLTGVLVCSQRGRGSYASK